MPQPVIARVHGIATAAGCQLVAACDLAVSADDARFAVSGVNLGLFCSTPSGKGLFYRQIEMGTEAAYQLAGQTMACNMLEASALEGVQAFLDKRSPSW